MEARARQRRATAVSRATSPGRRSACAAPDEGETVVHDLIRGEVTFENRLADDLVIARGDGTPLYNFAVAVDDAEMGITDVVRGDDHLSNTPKQLLVLEALGLRAAALRPPAAAPRPGREEALEAPRRRVGAGARARRATCRPRFATTWRCSAGGPTTTRRCCPPRSWSSGSRSSESGKASAIFDEQKLRWMNGRFMRELPLAEYEQRLADHLRRDGPRGRRQRSRPPRPSAAPPPARSSARRRRRWPRSGSSIGFLFTEPVDDDAAWAKVMVHGGRRACWAAPARRSRASSRSRRSPSRRALAAIVEAEGVKAEGPLPADARGAHREHRLAGDLRVGGGARDATRRVARIDAALVRLGRLRPATRLEVQPRPSRRIHQVLAHVSSSRAPICR